MRPAFRLARSCPLPPLTQRAARRETPPPQGDTRNRKWLFCLLVLVGEGPCLATYFARSYADLFALRTLTGISIGGCPPLVYSLMADFFPASRRSTVNAVFGVAQGVGIGFGQGIASALGQRGDWRLPFAAIALPTFAVTAAVAAFVEEPRRGAQARNALAQERPRTSPDTQLPDRRAAR